MTVKIYTSWIYYLNLPSFLVTNYNVTSHLSSFLVTKIPIFNGWSNESGILEMESTIDIFNKINAIFRYDPIGDYPTKAIGCLSAPINWTTIVGEGWDSSNKALKEVFMFESGSFTKIKLLNIPRCYSSSIILSRPHSIIHQLFNYSLITII